MATKKKPTKTAKPPKVAPPPTSNTKPIEVPGPQFGQPDPTPDPTKFVTHHASDSADYKILDTTKQQPRPFPIVKGVDEPVLTLADALGPDGATATAAIEAAGQIVFHSVGDSGNTTGPRDEEMVADKMVSDFVEQDKAAVPAFFYHLGDVIYSFGESQYYYDQFYEPYRDYPAPIFAIAGNHDGMVAPNTSTPTLQAFLDNFCTAGQPPHRTPEAGGLARTAGIQPGVYFTLEAPFVRILGLYSNCLEDPGIISTEGGKYPYLTDVQLTFLETALKRIADEEFAGAVIIALHHPPYVAELPTTGHTAGRHASSRGALADIDSACEAAGVWPHAVLSGHAHNYQRFTRSLDGRQTPFLVAGDGGHGISRLSRKGSPAIRVPMVQPGLSNGSDQVVFESYDDQDFGYLRVIVDPKQLRIEYHPATDGDTAKTPDDFVTVDLATRTLVHFQPVS
jgi:Calcineurin-like phosphoesterase